MPPWINIFTELAIVHLGIALSLSICVMLPYNMPKHDILEGSIMLFFVCVRSAAVMPLNTVYCCRPPKVKVINFKYSNKTVKKNVNNTESSHRAAT